MPAAIRRKRPAPVADETSIILQDATAKSGRPSRKAKTVAASKLDRSFTSESSVTAEVSDEDVPGGATPTPSKSKRRSTKKLAAAAGSASGRKSKTPTKQILEVSESDSPLYASLVKGDSQEALELWAQEYEREPYAATAEMITVFVRCSGCNEPVTEDMLTDVEQACNSLVENFGEESDGYPLAQRAPKDRQFRELLDGFIANMFEICQGEIIVDNYFINTLISWLITLGSSMVRALRHTAAYAALIIGDELVEAKVELTKQLAITERHLAAENKKGKKGSPKANALASQVRDLKSRNNVFDENLDSLFEGVIMHRYRDVAAPIRQITLETLGQWICAIPSIYLDDTYLKYLGWSLNDRDAAVRNVSLSALLEIYSEEGVAEHLSLFSQRFKLRMMNMVEDISDEVGVTAMKMMTQLAEMDLLEPSEVDQLLEFMFCETAAFSHAAGELFVKTIIEGEIDVMLNECDSPSNRDAIILVQLCRKLTTMTSPISGDMKATYAVDALFDHIAEFTGWKTFYELFQQDNCATIEEVAELPIENTTMTPAEENMLFYVLRASALRATGRLQIPTHRLIALGSRQKLAAAECATEITDYFMAKIPDMLSKFGADYDKSRVLIDFIQIFDLSLYETNRMTKQFSETLRFIRSAVTKNHDAEYLNSCMETLLHLADPNFPLHAKTESAIAELLEELTDKFCKTIANGVPIDEDQDDDEELSSDCFQLVSSLQRLNAFAHIFSIAPNTTELLDAVVTVLNAASESDVPETATTVAIPLAAKLLFHMFAEADLDPAEIDFDATQKIDRIVTMRDSIVGRCSELLSAGTEAIQRSAYAALLDCSSIFSSSFASVKSRFADLALQFDETLQSQLFEFLSVSLNGLGNPPSEKKRKLIKRKGQKSKRSRVSEDGNYGEGDEDVADQLERLALSEEEAIADEASAEQELHVHRLLASFGRAVVSGSIQTTYIGELFQFYTKSAQISELIRYILSQLRDSNARGCYEAILHGMQSIFTDATKNGEDLTDLRDLAHRVALTYGINNAKDDTRRSIISIHRRGIEFALEGGPSSPGCPPENIKFLDILKEFSIKLHNQDKSGPNGIVEHLESCINQHSLEPSHDDSDWDPYFNFHNNLTNKKAKPSQKPSSAKVSTAKKAKNRPKRKSNASGGKTRKRLSLGDDDDDNEEEEFWGKLDDEEVENYDSSEEGSPNSGELDKSSSRRPSSRSSRSSSRQGNEKKKERITSPKSGRGTRSSSRR